MSRLKTIWGQRFVRVFTMAMALTMLLGVGSFVPQSISTAYAAKNSCQLNTPQGKNVQHVIYIQFDNTHLMRDDPNVPSDLEQMPNLLNFMKSNGTLLSNDHTALIAHTATGILTSLTGVYGDRHGVPVSNSFRYFNPDGTTNPGVSFAYWTAPIFDSSNPPAQTDTTFNMLSADGKNAPAPWVPYTRAGCNVGSVATANSILENTAIDIPTVFGANSPEAAEVKANPAQATSDFVGIGVHCAQGNALCSAAHQGRPDLLPDEPGGYSGYQGLFGNKYVAPQISPGGPVTDINGNVIQDPAGHIGFPGFDGMSAATSLGYVAAMQEHGVPVTYAYISDAHDRHPSGPAFGPGEAGYVAALKAYDDAFGKFFARLQRDGITKDNTLFVFTVDEGDHFVGSAPSPAGCDGVTTPCTYSKIGELNANYAGLLATQKNVTTPFTVHSDSAPTVYITGNPARDASVTRTFEQATAGLTATNLITGNTDKITNLMADPVEMKLLHMITADPARTPTFTLFANPDYFLFAGARNCNSPCVTEPPSFAWNHGDVAPDIGKTWVGFVGPGVQHMGLNDQIWADHTDVRPTMLGLLGLKDDYRHDGRVLFEILNAKALPKEVRDHLGFYVHLAQVYKQINAPFGQLGLDTLKTSTTALASTSENDETYTQLEQELQQITDQRNVVASQIIALLESAEFGGSGHGQQAKLIDQANALLKQAHTMATRH
ncbi:MAG: hypothetical protein J2P36_11990 [Ktedonobacteraceae bacterium]|nr:hypothetical protein [Ktedonobacteraceae bacterium]